GTYHYLLQVGDSGRVDGRLLFWDTLDSIEKNAWFENGSIRSLVSCQQGRKRESFYYDGDTLHIRSYFTDGGFQAQYKVLNGRVLYSYEFDATRHWRLRDQLHGIEADSYLDRTYWQWRRQYKNLPAGIAELEEEFTPSGAL